MKLSNYLVAVTLLISLPALAQNYVCESPATLEGTLITSKSDPAMSSDEKSHAFSAVQLKTPISIGCQADDEFCSPEQNVSVLQLVLAKNQTKQFKELKGKSVKITGKLFHAENGNHYTNVLMNVENIQK